MDFFEAAVLAQAPRGAVVVGSSISPDGRFAVAQTYLRSANYLMDDVFQRTTYGWENHGGGGGGGTAWSNLDPGREFGVLRFCGEAYADATAAIVRYEATEHRVPVRHGHFLFVAWDTAYAEDPELLRFE